MLLPKLSLEAAHETTIGDTYTYSNGYGQLTKGGAQVQLGATVTAHVELEMVIVNNEETENWFQQHRSIFTAEQQSNIQQHLDSKNTASGWNAIFAYSMSSSHDSNFFQNANAKQVTDLTQQQQETLQSISKLDMKKVKVVGDIQITGVSQLPTQAFLFAQISTVNFQDGTTRRVINQSNPLAANDSGDTGVARAEPGKLKIMSL